MPEIITVMIAVCSSGQPRVFSHYFKPLVVSTFARIYQDISGDFTQITSIKSAKFRPGADTSASSCHGADTSHLPRVRSGAEQGAASMEQKTGIMWRLTFQPTT